MATANESTASGGRVLGVVLAWCVAVFLGVRAACDFYTFLCFAAVAVIFAAIALWLWIRGTRSTRWVITVAILSNAPACYVVQTYEAIRASNKVDLIVAALEKYKLDKGMYPKTLGTLTPRYLEALPSASVGFRSCPPAYSVHGDSYYLGYGGQDCGVKFHGPPR